MLTELVPPGAYSGAGVAVAVRTADGSIHRAARGQAGPSARMYGHSGNWPGGWTAKTVRFPDLGVTVAALSNDGDVPRMVDLTERVIDHFLPGRVR